jgi:hypothetical protein
MIHHEMKYFVGANTVITVFLVTVTVTQKTNSIDYSLSLPQTK